MQPLPEGLELLAYRAMGVFVVEVCWVFKGGGARLGGLPLPSLPPDRPNFQELLTDLKIVIPLDSGGEKASPTLLDRVAAALENPGSVQRFGGLSLGESWALVNGIRRYREADGEIRWLSKDNRGLIGLPVWIDRKTTRGTFEQFVIGEPGGEFSDRCWVSIQQPTAQGRAQ